MRLFTVDDEASAKFQKTSVCSLNDAASEVPVEMK